MGVFHDVVAGVGETLTSANDVAEVRVSLPAASVWSVIHQQMLIVGRRG